MKHYRQDPDAPRHLRKLVDAARRHNLDEATRRTVAKRLGIASTLDRSTETSAASSRLRTPARVSLGGIALTMLALVGGGATYLALTRPSPPDRAVLSTPPVSPPPTSTTEAALSPSPVSETPSVSVTTLLDVPPPPAPVARAPSVKSAPSTEPSAKGDLRLEVAALDRVHRTTEAGRPQEALSLLDEYATKFPKGRLREEAMVLRIEALHASGDQARAESLAEQLLRSSPGTPYAPRVRSALSADSP